MGFTSRAQQATTKTNVTDAPDAPTSSNLSGALSSSVASINALGEGYGAIAQMMSNS